MRRRLFQRLEQGVEGPRAQHVDFVDDVDLVGSPRGRIAHVVAQVAHLVHVVVRGAVDFDHVEAVARDDFLARIALVAGIGVLAALLAIQRLRQQARGGRLARAARSHEQVRVRHAVRLDRARERLDHVVLADHLLELLRAPFARQNFV